MKLQVLWFPQLRSEICKWERVIKAAGKVAHRVSVQAPPRPLSSHRMTHSHPLFSNGVQRSSDRIWYRPSWQHGRDDSVDLWMIHQAPWLSHQIKKPCMSEHEWPFLVSTSTVAPRHEVPPPPPAYLGALMSRRAIKYKYARYYLEWLQMPRLERCIKWSWNLIFGWRKREFLPFHFEFSESRDESFHSTTMSRAFEK